ncbi:hypothetical protein [Fannyhessea vaginae]|uniref:hypothetical protein n=1 Tax=Fannyhessea vaginae TaxID=82135 RepID=UPI0023F29A72|nr:hypothetical protein [Fannyhessea vaginae]
MKTIDHVIPKLRPGTRLKSTPNGYILSTGSAYAPLNLDAATIVSKINGAKTIGDIGMEIFQNTPNLIDINKLSIVVQIFIAKIWQQGVFLQTDDDVSMAVYSYCANSCFYSPYFSCDLNLNPIYLSPILNAKYFPTIKSFKGIFGSLGLYVVQLDKYCSVKIQYCFLKTQVRNLYFLYAIYGDRPTIDDLKRAKQYLEHNLLDEENHIIKPEKTNTIKIIVYTLADSQVGTLPFTLTEKGVIKGEVNGEDLIINFICI